MKILRLLFLVLVCLVLQPVMTPSVLAQGDDEEETTIEGSDDEESTIEGSDDEKKEEDLEEQRKKNAGLAGGGAGKNDDPNAPKLKATLQQQVNEAIKKGVAWLKKAQGKDGSYGPVRANSVYGKPGVKGEFVRDETAPTSFALYTLAKCGVKKSDPVIRKGLEWLKKETLKTHDTTGKGGKKNATSHGHDPAGGPRALTTYESASIVMMIEAVYQQSAKLTGKHKKRRLYTKNPMSPPKGSRIPKDEWRWMHDRVLHLTVGRTVGSGGGRGRGGGGGSSRIPGTQNKGGGWRYGQANGDQDLSATQIVLLALRAASQAGYPIDRVSPNTWRWAAEFAKKQQLGNGAFTYQRGNKWTAAMDACGIGCLVICKEQMALAGQQPPSWIDGSIKRGLDHLNSIWSPSQNANGGRHHYYHLYGVERVGDLTGRTEFNGLNWYYRGALFLIAHQDPSGRWTDSGAFPPRDVLGTCFALLFLKRATPPTITISEKQ